MKSSDKKFKLLSVETLGIVIVLISIVGIVCLFAGEYLLPGIGDKFSGFLLGVFGYLSYAFLIVFAIIGVFSIASIKLKLKLSVKAVILAVLGIYALISIFHLAFNPYTGSYGTYLKISYKNGFTDPSIGGILFSLTVGLVCLVVKPIGAYIFYSLLLVLVVALTVLSIVKKGSIKSSLQKKQGSTSDNEVDLPFAISGVYSLNDEVSLPFGSVPLQNTAYTNEAQQPAINTQARTVDDALSKLDALTRGSYQDSISGDNISSFVENKTQQGYSNGVSDKIVTQNSNVYGDISYQDAFLDESAPNSKMYMPKDKDGNNPYTIKTNKAVVSEEKPQDSNAESAFDIILNGNKSTSFEDIIVSNKQEDIVVERRNNAFDEIVSKKETEVENLEQSAVSPNLVYSDPNPTTNNEVEPVSLTFEDMKDYDYTPPPPALFNSYDASEDKEQLREFIDFCSEKISELINVRLKYDMKVDDVHHGPTFTRFDLTVPMTASTKLIMGLSQDMGVQLKAESPLRIANVPKTQKVGVEVPNLERLSVGLKDVLLDTAFENSDPAKCPFIIGKDVTGKTLFLQLADLTHILLSGTTGSGKSIFARAVLLSLMYKVSPKDLRIIICDPKGTDFVPFAEAPHLLIDEIVTDAPKIVKVLDWAVQEMERRYSILQKYKVSKIADYNRIMKGNDHMSRILIYVDEFADLVGQQGKETMPLVQRLAQKARAAGIHLLLATQRPTVDIISGTIKSNLSTRIALKVQDYTASDIALGRGGAEYLLEHGDMMFYSQTNPQIQRAQGPNVTDEELFDVLTFIRENNVCIFDEKLKSIINTAPATSNFGGATYGVPNNDDRDMDLKISALRYVIEQKRTSISAIQREFRVGFNKAATIHDWMIKEGYISCTENGKAEINITLEQFKAKFGG